MFNSVDFDTLSKWLTFLPKPADKLLPSRQQFLALFADPFFVWVYVHRQTQTAIHKAEPSAGVPEPACATRLFQRMGDFLLCEHVIHLLSSHINFPGTSLNQPDECFKRDPVSSEDSVVHEVGT
jgi:hypothetical protein